MIKSYDFRVTEGQFSISNVDIKLEQPPNKEELCLLADPTRWTNQILELLFDWIENLHGSFSVFRIHVLINV